MSHLISSSCFPSSLPWLLSFFLSSLVCPHMLCFSSAILLLLLSSLLLLPFLLFSLISPLLPHVPGLSCCSHCPISAGILPGFWHSTLWTVRHVRVHWATDALPLPYVVQKHVGNWTNQIVALKFSGDTRIFYHRRRLVVVVVVVVLVVVVLIIIVVVVDDDVVVDVLIVIVVVVVDAVVVDDVVDDDVVCSLEKEINWDSAGIETWLAAVVMSCYTVKSNYAGAAGNSVHDCGYLSINSLCRVKVLISSLRIAPSLWIYSRRSPIQTR